MEGWANDETWQLVDAFDRNQEWVSAVETVVRAYIASVNKSAAPDAHRAGELIKDLTLSALPPQNPYIADTLTRIDRVWRIDWDQIGYAILRDLTMPG